MLGLIVIVVVPTKRIENNIIERSDKLAKGTFDDLTGKRFGKLVVLERVEDHISSGGYRYPKWKCVCDCGNEVDVISKRLKSNTTKSCGCYRREVASLLEHETHGDSANPEYKNLYNVWRGMRRRCTTPTHKSYHHYGGRGIVICKEWDEYENFKVWALNNGYRSGLSIDRINVDGDYEPSNCRWVTQKEQNNNRRNNHYVTYQGRTQTATEWAEELGIESGEFLRELNRFNDDISKVIEYDVKRYNQQFEMDGKSHTLKEWADIYGIKYVTLIDRFRTHSWSLEKSLKTPVRKREAVGC